MRYLRSCNLLESLEIFIVVKMSKEGYRQGLRAAHLNLEDIKASGFKAKIGNAMECFIGEAKRLEFGTKMPYGSVSDRHWTASMEAEKEKIQNELSVALRKVKVEERGIRVMCVSLGQNRGVPRRGALEA